MPEQDYRPLALFPCVELTATGNVHILAVFHTDSTSANVERLIGQSNNSFPVLSEVLTHQLVLHTGPAGIITFSATILMRCAYSPTLTPRKTY